MPIELQNYQVDPKYERRIVAFYDILGWRSHIKVAGTGSTEIGDLRRMILRAPRMLEGRREIYRNDLRFSTFSDNVVVSVPADDAELGGLLSALICFQISSIGAGFLVRGGITVGDIVHDQYSVFGPALNRAYELESVVADVPRIVLDVEPLETVTQLPRQFVAVEDGVVFLDGVKLAFIRKIQREVFSGEMPSGENYWKRMGLLGSPREGLGRFFETPADLILQKILTKVTELVRCPLSDQDWKKVAWLHDRIASELGRPPATSYPRVRPEAME